MTSSRWRAALVAALALATVVGVPASPVQAAAVPATFTFSGSGWGHGLGMSQYGAYGQALEGRSATQILGHYYSPATVSRTTTNPDIRVQVLGGVTSVTVGLTASAGMTYRLQTAGGATPTYVPLTGSVTFTVSGANVSALSGGTTYTRTGEFSLEWSGTRYYNPAGGAAARVTVPGANAGSGSVTYKNGRLLVGPLSGKVNVVNQVRLNTEYLYGLAEMPSSWPSAALQAQAIAGRTYALRAVNAGVRSDINAHLTDETSSQKYTAWNKQNEATYGVRWVAAVNATIDSAAAAQVVTHNGSLVQTYYSSSTGGKTMNSEDVWGGATLPYLRSRDDHWALLSDVHNPNTDWVVTKTQAQMASLFGLADVARVVVTAKASSGAVKQMQATSSTGVTKYLLTKATTDGVRTKLGLKSAYFVVGSRSAVQRLAGADRSATAAAIGRAAFPTGTDVVLVSAANQSMVDGLVAAPFARSVSAPVLVAGQDSLPAPTRDELVRRGATHAWLIGGEGVLGPELVQQLADLGIAVSRVSGSDRYSTAAAVAAQMGSAATVVVASGAQTNLVDAAAAGGPAAASGQPILLTPPDTLAQVTADAIEALGATSVLVVGGTGAVSNDVVAALSAQGLGVARASGPDRFSTAVAVANRYVATVGDSAVLLASGENSHLIDSLTGGVLGHVTLLTNGSTVPAPTAAWLAGREVPLLRVAGGTGAVPDSVVEALR